MKTHRIFSVSILSVGLAALVSPPLQAAIALDRTRVIFDGSHPSTTVSISNQNKTLPYLAQAWVEDAGGKKIDGPLTALPPLQRVEPGAKSQIKIQSTANLAALPQDRESLFWFNVREIPPKASTANTLQIALQTRVKMFYRPASLIAPANENNVWQKQLTLTRQGDRYVVNNPTGYFVTLVNAEPTEKGAELSGFQPVMVEPKGSAPLGGSAGALGSHPVLTFINDWGGRPQLIFTCGGERCSVSSLKEG